MGLTSTQFAFGPCIATRMSLQLFSTGNQMVCLCSLTPENLLGAWTSHPYLNNESRWAKLGKFHGAHSKPYVKPESCHPKKISGILYSTQRINALTGKAKCPFHVSSCEETKHCQGAWWEAGKAESHGRKGEGRSSP